MKILAVGAHPDDLEHGCFGTLAKCAARGDKISVCVVSNGNLGHELIQPEDLGKIREAEAASAARLIGADFYAIGCNDLYIKADDDRIIKRLGRVIRHAAPDMIITHSENDYHSDHNETYKAVFKACFAASVGHYDPECSDPTAAPAIIYQMDNLTGVNFIPTEYVDISDFIDIKIKALACHKSQTEWMKSHDRIDFEDMIRTCSRARGYQCGVKYAEGFRPVIQYARTGSKRLLP